MKHGGKRIPGPGKSLGRPPSPFISKRVVLHFESEEEYRMLRNTTDPRQRVEFIIKQLAREVVNSFGDDAT